MDPAPLGRRHSGRAGLGRGWAPPPPASAEINDYGKEKNSNVCSLPCCDDETRVQPRRRRPARPALPLPTPQRCHAGWRQAGQRAGLLSPGCCARHGPALVARPTRAPLPTALPAARRVAHAARPARDLMRCGGGAGPRDGPWRRRRAAPGGGAAAGPHPARRAARSFGRSAGPCPTCCRRRPIAATPLRAVRRRACRRAVLCFPRCCVRRRRKRSRRVLTAAPRRPAVQHRVR